MGCSNLVLFIFNCPHLLIHNVKLGHLSFLCWGFWSYYNMVRQWLTVIIIIVCVICCHSLLNYITDYWPISSMLRFYSFIYLCCFFAFVSVDVVLFLYFPLVRREAITMQNNFPPGLKQFLKLLSWIKYCWAVFSVPDRCMRSLKEQFGHSPCFA